MTQRRRPYASPSPLQLIGKTEPLPYPGRDRPGRSSSKEGWLDRAQSMRHTLSSLLAIFGLSRLLRYEG